MLAPYVVLTVACTTQPSTPPQQAAQQQPATSSPAVTDVDPKGLWRDDYAALERQALADQNVAMLAKLADAHHNTAIASLNERDLQTHVKAGKTDAQTAVDAYRAQHLPLDSIAYANLLYRLGLFEEKLGDFASAERHIVSTLGAQPAPPRTPQQTFSIKMDLARIYIAARRDKEAARLIDELLAQYRKDRTVTDAQLVLFDTWIKAQERINAHPEEVEKMRTLTKRLKLKRADQLEREANDALEVEKQREKEI